MCVVCHLSYSEVLFPGSGELSHDSDSEEEESLPTDAAITDLQPSTYYVPQYIFMK